MISSLFYKKIIGLVLMLSIIINLASCAQENNSDNSAWKSELLVELPSRAAAYTDANISLTAKTIIKAFNVLSDEDKANRAIELADDMSRASMLGVITADFLAVAANAVNTYPHPLLLNNFASLLHEKGDTSEALYFYLLSLEQEPANPVLLVNIANLYYEMGDDTAADRYIKKALAAAPDYGAAYQLKTTMHLKNGNSELAAETMIKSAAGCFNDISVYHFGSFLDEVMGLDPLEDEYPLKETFIDELYKIAREYNDMRPIGDSPSDTPASQITIPPYPDIKAEQLEKSVQQLESEQSARQDEISKIQKEINELEETINEKEAEKESGKTEPAYNTVVFTVEKNLRQKLSVDVINSYYDFKLRKIEAEFNKDLEEYLCTEYDKETELANGHSSTLEKEEIEFSEAGGDMLASMIAAALDKKSESELVKKGKSLMNMSLQLEKLRLAQVQERYNFKKQKIDGAMKILRDWYNESKQILEEYWLKIGGYLKFFADEDYTKLVDLERMLYVSSHYGQALGDLTLYSYEMYDARQSINEQINMFEMTLSAYKEHMENLEEYEDILNGAKIPPDGYDKNNDILRLQEEGIPVFREKGDLDPIGLEFSKFGFGAAVSYDGEHVSYDIQTPSGDFGESYNIFDKTTLRYETFAEDFSSATVYSVAANFDPKWIANADIRGALLKGKESKLAKIGKVDFDIKAGSESRGTYEITDANDRVLDSGTIKTKEWAIGAGGGQGAGISDKTITFKSAMTGISTKKNVKKYRFMFVNISK